MKDKINIQKYAHIFFLSVIAIIFIIAVVKLIIWNNGTKFEVSDTSENLNTEVEDYFVTMDPALLEGREDDGVTTIVMLGDDILSSQRGEDGVATLVKESTNSTVYNCSFEGSSMASAKAVMDLDNHPMDAFSAYRISSCIATEDFQLLDYALANLEEPESYFADTIELLRNMDFNNVDIIMLHYGVNDYLAGRVTTNIYDPNDVASVTGSLAYTIETIQNKYPHIRIVVSSPTFCYYEEEDGTLVGSDLRKTGDNDLNTLGSLGDYMIAMKVICVERNVTFIDNYYGVNINTETAQQYLEDNVVPNKEGRKMLADHISDVVNNKLY